MKIVQACCSKWPLQMMIAGTILFYAVNLFPNHSRVQEELVKKILATWTYHILYIKNRKLLLTVRLRATMDTQSPWDVRLQGETVDTRLERRVSKPGRLSPRLRRGGVSCTLSFATSWCSQMQNQSRLDAQDKLIHTSLEDVPLGIFKNTSSLAPDVNSYKNITVTKWISERKLIW